MSSSFRRFHFLVGLRLTECCFGLFLGLQQHFADHNVSTCRGQSDSFVQIGYGFFQETVSETNVSNYALAFNLLGRFSVHLPEVALGFGSDVESFVRVGF